nr:hypothetical protein [Tanacetum cinerariifolium]
MFYGKKCVVTAGAWIKEGCEEDFTIGKGFPAFASYGEPCVYGTPALEFLDLIKVAVCGGRECDPDSRIWGPAEMVVERLTGWLKVMFGDRVKWEDGSVMSGFSGHGFKMAPVVGRILVDMVVGGKAAAVKRDEEIKLVPSCCEIFDLEPLSLSFDFVFTSEIFKSLSFSLDRLCHLAILCLDQHAHNFHLLESSLIIAPEAWFLRSYL